MSRKIWQVLFITICIVILASMGVVYAQQKKVGGGEVKYEGKGSTGPVVFSHESHVNKQKAKCTDCHTKIFKMKKEMKMTKAVHAQDKLCGACHNGKKAFSQSADADCAKCHIK